MTPRQRKRLLKEREQAHVELENTVANIDGLVGTLTDLVTFLKATEGDIQAASSPTTRG